MQLIVPACIVIRKYSEFAIVHSTEVKDDSDYLAFKETTWSYIKFVYRSTFLCEPVLPRSQPIQICCTTMTNMQTELRYVHLYFNVLLVVLTLKT